MMRSFLTIGLVAAAMAAAATLNGQAPPRSGAMTLTAEDMQRMAAAA